MSSKPFRARDKGVDRQGDTSKTCSNGPKDGRTWDSSRLKATPSSLAKEKRTQTNLIALVARHARNRFPNTRANNIKNKAPSKMLQLQGRQLATGVSRSRTFVGPELT